MEDESEKIIAEEQMIEESSFSGEEDEEYYDQESNIEEEDQLMPRPVFQIEENHENLTQDEKEAFSYILAVRSQKRQIITSKKRNGQKITFFKEEKNKIHTELQGQGSKVQQNVSQINELWNELSEWRQQTINNWHCVIANMKYLIKLQNKEEFKQKIKLNCLNYIPLIQKLCFNKWLQLPQIQNLLVSLTNSRENYLQKMSEKEDWYQKKDNYHLWIYSLLALHQSYASYNNFQALAFLNGSIINEFQFFNQMQKGQRKEEQNKLFKRKVISWLTTLVILVSGFNQIQLKQRLTILRSLDIFE